jgi:hypothetical protein
MKFNELYESIISEGVGFIGRNNEVETREFKKKTSNTNKARLWIKKKEKSNLKVFILLPTTEWDFNAIELAAGPDAQSILDYFDGYIIDTEDELEEVDSKSFEIYDKDDY